MRILLTDYNKNENTTIRIYRHYETFSRDELPPVLVELPGDTTEYHDLEVEVDRMVYYRMSVVHNGNETVGPLYNTMKRFYTGPQINTTEPDTILRGDSFVGRYGNLKLDLVLPLAKALEALPSCSAIPGINLDEVYVEKCSYNGKVLFISSMPLLKGTVRGLYQDGALFPAGDGEEYFEYYFYRAMKDKYAQGLKSVMHNNYNFRVRLMTDDEFTNLYVKMYPDSVAGMSSNRVISNTPTHNSRSPVTLRRYDQKENFKTVGLDTVTTETDWEVETDLYMVVELLDIGNMGWPEVIAKTSPTDPTDRMMFCQAAYMNGRAHFFGGLYSKFNDYSAAVTTHISFNMDGGDRQVHAPMPTGVYYGVTWTHENKIYCFGGVKEIGSSQYSYKSLYQDIQVWEDDGTQDGVWTTMPSSIPYRFVPGWTRYTDETTDKEYIVVVGGYKDEIENGAKVFAKAEITTFDGTWETYNSSTYEMGGAGLHQYKDGFLMALAHRTPNTISRSTGFLPYPKTPTSSAYYEKYYTQSSEMVYTRYGKMFSYKESIFMVAEDSGDTEAGKIFIYQWVPSEMRWLNVTIMANGITDDNRGSVSYVFHDGKLVFLWCQPWTNANWVSLVFSTTLIDPLEAPVVPIEILDTNTSRIFVGQLDYRT